MQIVVKPQGNGYVAHVENNAAISGYGKTPEEAIGNLIFTHQDQFRLSVSLEPS